MKKIWNLVCLWWENCFSGEHFFEIGKYSNFLDFIIFIHLKDGVPLCPERGMIILYLSLILKDNPLQFKPGTFESWPCGHFTDTSLFISTSTKVRPVFPAQGQVRIITSSQNICPWWALMNKLLSVFMEAWCKGNQRVVGVCANLPAKHSIKQ